MTKRKISATCTVEGCKNKPSRILVANKNEEGRVAICDEHFEMIVPPKDFDMFDPKAPIFSADIKTVRFILWRYQLDGLIAEKDRLDDREQRILKHLLALDNRLLTLQKDLFWKERGVKAK